MRNILKKAVCSPDTLWLYLLYSIAVIFILLFFILPLGNLLIRGLSVFLESDRPLPPDFFSYVIRITRNTLNLGVLTTFITLFAAVPTAILIVKFNIGPQRLLISLFTIPMITPAFITSFATIILLGRSGVITMLFRYAGFEMPSVFGLGGLLVTQVLHTIPYAVIILIAGLKGVPRHVEEAALSMGSSVLRIHAGIVLPYILPYILMSGLMVFLTSIGDVGGPLIIGGNYEVLSIAIFSNYISFLDDERIPLILSLWIIIISFILLFVVNRIMEWTKSRYMKGYDPMTYDIASVRKTGSAWILILTSALLMPYLVIFIHSLSKVWVFELIPKDFTFDNYIRIFSNLESLFNTVILIALAAPLMIFLGLVLSHMFRYKKQLKWLNYITLIPFVLPGVVIGISLLQTYSQFHVFGSNFTSSLMILVIAVSIRRMPFVLKTLEAGFSRTDRTQEECAVSLGAGDFRIFTDIFYPQIKPVLYSAFLIAVVKIITELSASIIINPPGWQNMSMYIAYYVEEGLISRASAMSILLIAVISAGSAVSAWIAGKTSTPVLNKNAPDNWESILPGRNFQIRANRGYNIMQGSFRHIIYDRLERIKIKIPWFYDRKTPSLVLDSKYRILAASREFLDLMKADSIEHLRNASNFYSVFQIRDDYFRDLVSKPQKEEIPSYLFNLRGERIAVKMSVITADDEINNKQRIKIFLSPDRRKKSEIKEFEYLRQLADEAELRALKAQINPHFLFNTLNSIAELVESNPEKAVKITENLSDLFRFILVSTKSENIMLSEELDHVKQYLSIMKVRFENRLNVIWQVESGIGGYYVPPMIIQPIVENAINHGGNISGYINIIISAYKEKNNIIIKVSDCGTEPFRYSEVFSGKGTGLKNVDKRLRVAFRRGLDFKINEPNGLSVIITIPVDNYEY